MKDSEHVAEPSLAAGGEIGIAARLPSRGSSLVRQAIPDICRPIAAMAIGAPGDLRVTETRASFRLRLREERGA